MMMWILVITCIIMLLIFFIWYFIYMRELHGSDYVLSGNNHIDVDKLMIVAHPDDELIFGGRELLSEPGWLVVCVTNGTNNAGNIFSFEPAIKRCHEFIKIANLVGFRYEVWDFEDNGFNSNWPDSLIRSKIKQLLSRQKYTKIVTHNLNGEYGHRQHKKISRIVHDFEPENLFTFSFVSQAESMGNLSDLTTNPHIEKLEDLIKEYESQAKIVDKYRTNLLYQHIEPAKFKKL